MIIVSFRASNGQLVAAELGMANAPLIANRNALGPWEKFTLSAISGGSIEHDTPVSLQAANGLYVCAEAGGGREVVANRPKLGPWETFTLKRVAGPGLFQTNDQIGLQAFNGQYVCAEGSGGRDLVANRSAFGPWEKFSATVLDIPNSTITHPTFNDITNSEVRRVAQDVLNAARKSFTAVVADPDGTVSGDTAEAALAVAVKQLSPEIRTDAKSRAVALLGADRAAKEIVFGRFAETSTDIARNSGFQTLVESAEPLTLNLAKLGIIVPSASRKIQGQLRAASKEDSLEPLIDDIRFAEAWGSGVQLGTAQVVMDPTDPTIQPQLPAKMKFWVRGIRCNDETNPEWPSNDEMALAGVSINERGDIQQIAERHAGDGYKDGVEKQLNWTDAYSEFDLNSTNIWPKRYGITLILAEKDHDGLTKAMQKIWEKTREAVFKALEAAALAAGVAIATFLGMPQHAAAIGQVLAIAAKWVIDELVKWLIDMFKDDIFKPTTVWVNVPSIAARWNFSTGQWGSSISPLMSETYNGFGGQYRLDYQWERSS